MPKVSRVGKFRATAKASSATSPLTSKQNLADLKKVDNADKSQASGEVEPLSRGQRKRHAKREQYLKREKMVLSSLRLQHLEEQKGKLDGLDAIREALPSSNSIRLAKEAANAQSSKQSSAATPQVPACGTNKSKKTLANSEISHMGLVLDHPSFKENPFAAIQQHLRNSLAPQKEKLEQDSLKRTQEEKKVDAKKKEEKKERLLDAKFSRKKSKFHSNRTRRS